nr:MAG: hypothetical protein [Caudoviricetes sp.]
MDIGNLGFKQEIVDDIIYREFEPTMDEDQLYWHKDAANRLIYVIEGEGWKLQMDNEIPFTLTENCEYFIQKETFHRLHLGKSKLILKIQEF